MQPITNSHEKSLQRKQIFAVSLGYPVSYESSHPNIVGSDHTRYQIDSCQAWSSNNNSQKSWIQVCSLKKQEWISLILQGRFDQDQWVTKFRICYSSNGNDWEWVQDGKEFIGNSDRNSKIRINFKQPIIARTIRIHPTQFKNHVSLRFQAIFLQNLNN